jgi:excisionase family DNA binding protein
MQRNRQIQAPQPIELAPLQRLARSIEEAAEVLSLGRNLTLQLIDEGRLRVVRVGRWEVVPVVAIEAFLGSGG